VEKFEDSYFKELNEIAMRFRILHAVDKSLDEISVSEICKNAGISRYTFYKYFGSKFDLPIWHGIFCQRFYLNEAGRTIDWQTGYFHDFRLLSKEESFYSNALEYTSRNSEGLNLMEDYRKDVILETLRDYRQVEITDILMFCVETFVKTETEAVATWLRNGCKIQPEVFAKYMIAIMPRALYGVVELDSPKSAS